MKTLARLLRRVFDPYNRSNWSQEATDRARHLIRIAGRGEVGIIRRSK